jgi:DNA-binding response OmpR family regulator
MTAENKVLLIEDESKVAAFIKSGLEQSGYQVTVENNGESGLKTALSGGFNLIILDINLPFVNGIQVCRKIRSEKLDVAIIMLTALGTMEDKLDGFDAGADDYLLKPFEFAELIARIKAVGKRLNTKEPEESVLTAGDLLLDLNKKLAFRNKTEISLTAKEFLLLEYLMRNKGKVVSKVDISENVWDINFDTGTNVVEVYINILRKKIDKDFEQKLIHTRGGMGYVLKSD